MPRVQAQGVTCNNLIWQLSKTIQPSNTLSFLSFCLFFLVKYWIVLAVEAAGFVLKTLMKSLKFSSLLLATLAFSAFL